MTHDSRQLADQLARMLQALERIERYTRELTAADFQDNELVQDAVFRNLEVLGEASGEIERDFPDLAEDHPEAPLTVVQAVRRSLDHEDFRADPARAWRIARKDVPALGEQLRELLRAFASLEAFCESLPRRASRRGGDGQPLPVVHGCSTERVKTLQRQVAGHLDSPVAFRDALADGSSGPEMLVIPPGRFLMGSPEEEGGRFDNEDQHEVVIGRAFALGRYTVSFAEYDRFCAATGREAPSDWGWGRGRSPVVSVSWTDALEYCAWLGAETGQDYRLPTEAEWEYACRAGTTTPFWWGAEMHPVLANFAGEHRRTLPVDTLQPNPWGLFHVHGNVWEWTDSDYTEYYDGAEAAHSQGHGEHRAIRGGAWNNRPRHCRAAYRNRERPEARLNCLGFRLARSL